MPDPDPARPEEVPEPAAPPQEVQDAMRRHLREEHGRGFRLRRDVAFRDNHPDRPILTYRAKSARGAAAFFCERCPGYVFTVGDPPYGDPERESLLLRQSPWLREATAGMSAEERSAFVEAHDRGELARDLLAQTSAGERRRTVRHRPQTEQRIHNCAAYLLPLWAAGATQEDAIWQLLGLQRSDPRRYREIMGHSEARAYETIRGYWRKFPPEALAKAKRLHDQARTKKQKPTG